MLDLAALDGTVIPTTQIYQVLLAANADGSYTVTDVVATYASLFPSATSATLNYGNDRKGTIDFTPSDQPTALDPLYGLGGSQTNFLLSLSDNGFSGESYIFETGTNPAAPMVGETYGPNGVTIPCFAGGTRISTVRGQVAVEALTLEDLVMTADGGSRPVRWVGRRRVDLARHPRPELAQPIRIVAGSFADGTPARDLLLSPDHAVLVDGKLVPARLLVNGGSIRRETTWRSVRYFHVELDAHDVLLAEGLPAESYLDTGNRAAFEDAGRPMLLHPDFSDVRGGDRAALSCRPLATSPEDVEPIWQALAARAAAIGRPAALDAATTEPELRLAADGIEIAPDLASDGRHEFSVPAGCTRVQIVSRAAAPSELRPWLDDRRILGVCVSGIAVRVGDGEASIALDDPGLGRGWHAIERAGEAAWRWTDGAASLDVPPGTAALRLSLVGGASYPAAVAPAFDGAVRSASN